VQGQRCTQVSTLLRRQGHSAAVLIGKLKVSVKVPCCQQRRRIMNLASLEENGVLRARGCTIAACIAMLLGNYRKHAEHPISHAVTDNGVALSKLAPPWTVGSGEVTQGTREGAALGVSAERRGRCSLHSRTVGGARSKTCNEAQARQIALAVASEQSSQNHPA
jgi:hypothetical protein